MSPKATSAVATFHDLYPKVVKNCALNTARVNARVQRAEGGADRFLKLLEGSAKIWEAFQCQLESCYCARNWIYIDADDSCA